MAKAEQALIHDLPADVPLRARERAQARAKEISEHPKAKQQSQKARRLLVEHKRVSMLKKLEHA